jgi:hypothetical protein
MKKLIVAAALALSMSRALCAQTAALADLAWFTGHWVDDAGGNLSEETWTAPSGDSMQGMWRYVMSGKTRIYEILTITAEDGGLVMRIRHFDPKLVGREEKATPVALKLVASQGRSAVFEGPELGSSTPGVVRLSYSRPTDDALVVTLEKGGKKEGFTFRRAAN